MRGSDKNNVKKFKRRGGVCPVCKDKQLGDVTIDFREHLRQAFRTHDEHAIYSSVEGIRDQLLRGGLKQHLEEKKYGKQAFEDLFQIGQAKLPA